VSSALCVIWQTPADLLEKAGDYEVYDSPRAGGKYWISGTASAEVLPLNNVAKQLLTTWLCQQRRAGVEIPKIESPVFDFVRSLRPLSVTARVTAALLFLGDNIKELGEYISVGGADAGTLRCSAYTESRNLRELSQLFQMLRETELVDGAFSASGSVQVRPTAKGWRELEALVRQRTDSSQAFVAMWFDDSTNDAYVKGILPAVNATGYKAVRIDKKEHNNRIDDEIIAKIRRSRFLIADFTCRAGEVRGGVYYEAGFAQGIGIPVIWTCKDTSMPDLHFDTRQYAHIVWKNASDLFIQLKDRIGATIGDGPLPKS
jgi:nucleoside 2-deoxyribosyltransferase